MADELLHKFVLFFSAESFSRFLWASNSSQSRPYELKDHDLCTTLIIKCTSDKRVRDLNICKQKVI